MPTCTWLCSKCIAPTSPARCVGHSDSPVPSTLPTHQPARVHVRDGAAPAAGVGIQDFGQVEVWAGAVLGKAGSMLGTPFCGCRLRSGCAATRTTG